MRSENTIRVLAAVVRDGDRMLICQRPPEKRHGGLWEFPGGKVEAGESDLDAARRELSEELGVTVDGVGRELLAVRDENSPFLIAFVETSISGTPACHEHTALAWVSLDAISGYDLAPSDRTFATHLVSTQER